MWDVVLFYRRFARTNLDRCFNHEPLCSVTSFINFALTRTVNGKFKVPHSFCCRYFFENNTIKPSFCKESSRSLCGNWSTPLHAAINQARTDVSLLSCMPSYKCWQLRWKQNIYFGTSKILGKLTQKFWLIELVFKQPLSRLYLCFPLINTRFNLLIEALEYSKNPHKITSGLRTLRLKFGQQSTIYIRTNSAWQTKKCSYIKKMDAS